MKVKTLIQKLQKLDPNYEVILASDSEGNSYHELNSVNNDEIHYAQRIERYDDGMSFEREIELGDLCDFKPVTGYTKPKKCIVLYP